MDRNNSHHIQPLVSVVLPVHNGEAFLHQAIASVLSQSFADFECIVIDDGSEDATSTIAKSINDLRLRLVRHECRKGFDQALNTGIALARAGLLARIDADDVMEPDRLRTQVEYLEKCPDIAVVGSSLTEIDSNGTVIRICRFPLTPASAALRLLLGRMPVPHPGLLMRRAALNEVGAYRSFNNSHDFDLCLRLSANGCRFSNLDVPLTRYRRHPSQISRLSADVRLDARVPMFQSFTEGYLQLRIDQADARRYLRYWSFDRIAEDAALAIDLAARIIRSFRERNPDLSESYELSHAENLLRAAYGRQDAVDEKRIDWIVQQLLTQSTRAQGEYP